MRIRIVKVPPIDSIDGIRFDCFDVGREYEVGNSIAALFLAERWAEPVPLDTPRPFTPYTDDDPFDARILYQGQPANLVKVSEPPLLDRAVASDYQRRKRKRRRS
jgi:hypothetical protein